MTKVLIATEKPFAAAAVNGIKKIFEDAKFETVLLEKYTDKNDLLKAVADVDAMIVRSDKVTAEVIDAAKNLKIVVRAGAGFDNLDLNACNARKIVAMNTPGQNSNAVAELAVAMMVFMARGNFKNNAGGSELKDKKLGIHAYGAVGKLVAKIAKGFGMKVYAFDPFVTKEAIEADGVAVVEKIEDLYNTCQYVSLHIPANDKTKKSINYTLLANMPKGATLVNTARKEVIHEEDLKKLMSERSDFKYISDIMPDMHNDFLQFETRYYATPKKQGAETAEANINAGLAAANQIVGFIKDGVTKFQVNKF